MRKKVKERNRSLKGKARRGTMTVTEVEVTPRSPYMGSRLTVQNRSEYIKAQKENFIKNQHQFFENRKTEIMEQEGTDEEKEFELLQLEQGRLKEDVLEKRAEHFARFQANKEAKHYKAYLAGQVFYKYKGQIWPVVTEASLKASQKMIDIKNVEDNEQVHDGIDTGEGSQSAALAAVPAGDEGRIGETV